MISFQPDQVLRKISSSSLHFLIFYTSKMHRFIEEYSLMNCDSCDIRFPVTQISTHSTFVTPESSLVPLPSQSPTLHRGNHWSDFC